MSSAFLVAKCCGTPREKGVLHGMCPRRGCPVHSWQELPVRSMRQMQTKGSKQVTGLHLYIVSDGVSESAVSGVFELTS